MWYLLLSVTRTAGQSETESCFSSSVQYSNFCFNSIFEKMRILGSFTSHSGVSKHSILLILLSSKLKVCFYLIVVCPKFLIFSCSIARVTEQLLGILFLWRKKIRKPQVTIRLHFLPDSKMCGILYHCSGQTSTNLKGTRRVRWLHRRITVTTTVLRYKRNTVRLKASVWL